MIGFWKQNSEDVDDVFLMGINVKGVPLTTRNLIHSMLTGILHFYSELVEGICGP